MKHNQRRSYCSRSFAVDRSVASDHGGVAVDAHCAKRDHALLGLLRFLALRLLGDGGAVGLPGQPPLR